jgi:hypothetical protein
MAVPLKNTLHSINFSFNFKKIKIIFHFDLDITISLRVVSKLKKKKIEKEKAKEELRVIGKDIKFASDSFVELTGVKGDADLRMRRKCCCPNYEIVKEPSWDEKSGLKCPNGTKETPQGNGMGSPFRGRRKKNRCAWLFQLKRTKLLKEPCASIFLSASPKRRTHTITLRSFFRSIRTF